MTNDNSAERTLKSVESFLKQHAELFGDEILLPNGTAENVTQTHASSSETQDVAPVPSSQNPGRESRTIKISEDEGLFEGTVLSSEWKIDPHWHDSDSLDVLNKRISGCKKCSLGNTRKSFVFGVGNPEAKLVFIGEAPGADEDEQGEPFVGRAGQLLTKILVAVQLRREDVYICNILKCRPPNNREPLPTEVEACEPFLRKQLDIIKPKLIMCLGRVAGQALLKLNVSLTEFRNNTYEYQGIQVMVTYHPAALLRNPNWKRPAWEDFQKMRKLYESSI